MGTEIRGLGKLARTTTANNCLQHYPDQIIAIKQDSGYRNVTHIFRSRNTVWVWKWTDREYNAGWCISIVSNAYFVLP